LFISVLRLFYVFVTDYCCKYCCNYKIYNDSK